MTTLFFILITLFIIIHIIRFSLSIKHFNSVLKVTNSTSTLDGRVSIIQPILSGDEDLNYTLSENVKNIPYAHFIWLVDKDDLEGIRITKQIKEEMDRNNQIEVIYIDKVPQGVNPKVYKMLQGIESLREFCVVLDDDAIIKVDRLKEAFYRLEKEDLLITGLPYFEKKSDILSDLVGAFINSNSLGTYMATAQVDALYTINGMFYITRTETLKRLDAFEKIKDKLCDDYEIAKVYTEANIALVQSNINCIVSTDIKDMSHYTSLMKRWMVFANRYISKNMSLKLFLIVILPNLLPILLLSLAIYLGSRFVGIYLILHLSKNFINLLLRNKLYKSNEGLSSISYELIADILQFFHYVYSIVAPNTIKWRDKYIKLDRDNLDYGHK